MDFSWPLVVAGALVGFMVGLTGMGGGALMTPILVLLFGVSPSTAVGSDLAASVMMKPVGALVHHRARTVRWDLVRWLLPTGVPAAFGGAFVLPALGNGPRVEHWVQIAIGAALILAVAGMPARALLAHRTTHTVPEEPVALRRIPALMIGLTGGLIVGMTSVGSGSLIIVMLMLTHPRLRPNQLVGTDLAQAVPLVLAAAAGHLIVGDTQFGLTAIILLGAIPGTYLGARLSSRAPNGALRWILAILLVASALSLWRVPTTITLLACGALATAGLATMSVHRVRSRNQAAAARHPTRIPDKSRAARD